MARPVMADMVMADMVDESAPMLLEQLRREGFQLCVEGDRLRIRPVDRLTPALREALARRKPELLALLAPVSEYVTLRGGLTLPLPALQLAWNLEDRGFRMTLDADLQFHIEPTAALTDTDLAAIARWRLHLGAIIGYTCPEVG